MPDAPANENKLVKRIDPQAAHPIPKIPLAMPKNPVTMPFCFIPSILLRKKYMTIARLIPNSKAIATVYEAESRVKLVVIPPKRLIGKSSFCFTAIPG